MKLALAAVLLAACATTAQAHPCDADAVQRATPLLRLHFEEPEADVYVGHEVKALAPIRALKGKGKFDVLEVWGAIYKAEYRMRFIYAQIPGSCVLIGQEILEASDPY